MGSHPQLAIKHDTIPEGGHLWAPLGPSVSASDSESESDSESDPPPCCFVSATNHRPWCDTDGSARRVHRKHSIVDF